MSYHHVRRLLVMLTVLVVLFGTTSEVRADHRGWAIPTTGAA